MFTSKSTLGFYDSSIHATMPDDVVEITTEAHAALMQGQSEGKVIAWGDDGFPYLEPAPAPDRAALETSAETAIKADRDRRKDLGVFADGSWFHSDANSRIQQLALVIMGAGMPTGIQWKTMGGTFVLMTPELAGKIFAATAALDQQLFARAELHRKAMAESPTPSAYDFSTGWPDHYQE